MARQALQHYQNAGVETDVKLLQGDDEITFSVLISLLQRECTDIFTNHESVIVCYSNAPFPVWVWVKDAEQPEDVTAIAQCLKEAFPMEQGHYYNLSYELLEKLKETDAYFCQAGRKTGLISHRLDAIQEIHHPCDGQRCVVQQEDLERLIPIWQDMVFEMEGIQHEAEFCRQKILRHIQRRSLFLWKNEEGETVAITGRGDMGKYSKVNAVYTLPGYRRKGYAINLVHQVTQDILKDGLIPILYTDADYIASNSCYEKIGYRPVGQLCTAIRK